MVDKVIKDEVKFNEMKNIKKKKVIEILSCAYIVINYITMSKIDGIVKVPLRKETLHKIPLHQKMRCCKHIIRMD